jgi:hypothetical protein
VAQIGVVFFHEADHPVVAEADLLELVLGEVIGLVLALAVLVEAVEAGLGELLALPPRPLLHSPAEIRVSLDAARRRPSTLLLLLLAAPRHAQDTILAVESGDSWVWEGEFGEEEADLLELVLGEVIGLVLALAALVEAVEAGLGELLALPPRPLLHTRRRSGGWTDLGIEKEAERERERESEPERKRWRRGQCKHAPVIHCRSPEASKLHFNWYKFWVLFHMGIEFGGFFSIDFLDLA